MRSANLNALLRATRPAIQSPRRTHNVLYRSPLHSRHPSGPPPLPAAEVLMHLVQAFQRRDIVHFGSRDKMGPAGFSLMSTALWSTTTGPLSPG